MLLAPFVEGRGGLASAQIPVFAGAPDCGEFASGTSVDASMGAAITLTGIVGPVGFTGSLSFGFGQSTLSVNPVEPTRILNEQGGSIVELEREYIRAARERIVSVDLLAHIDAGNRFWLDAGPTIAKIVGSTVEQSDNVTGPGRYRFSDGQSKHSMESAHNATAPPFNVGAAVMFGRSFQFGAREMNPYVSIRGDVTSRIDDAPMRSLVIGAGCRISFDVTPVRDPIEPIAISHDPTPVYKTPHASLAVYGIDANGKRQAAPLITVREVIEAEHLPLVPAIFFDRNSDTLSHRYSLRGEHDEAVRDERVVSVQRDVLDTLGSRMRSHPKATLGLWGAVSGDESIELASRRVATVRRYLSQTWGIDSSRIATRSGAGPLERSTEAGSDGREDNRRVEIASSDAAILAPMIATRTTRLFDPPAIELVPTIDAPEGIREWTIDLEHRGKHVARFTSDSNAANPMWSILSTEIDTALGTLAATLDVIDSVGAIAQARAETPIRLARELRNIDMRVEVLGDREIARHLLVAFEFDDALPGAVNERELAAIANAVRPDATVRVIGTADRIGEESHNAELARRRAVAVADALRTLLDARGAKSVKIDVAGASPSRARFTNDLPEGRFLSRGVEVIVEQDLQP